MDTVAAAISVIALVSVDGTLDGNSVDLPIGVITLASALCETPTAAAAAPLTASGLTPASGPTTGARSVTITGTGFTPETTVTFGATPATRVVVANDGNSLVATTPAAAAGPVSVTVTDPFGGTATLAYTYVAPTITAVTPTQGPASGNTTVTIAGTGLETTTGVTFGGTAGSIVSVSPDGTQVVATTPAGTGLADVTLTAPAGVTTTAADPFVFISRAAPRSPRSAPGRARPPAARP